jgi:hypothetical protein
MSDVFPRLKQILRISGVKVLHQHEEQRNIVAHHEFFCPSNPHMSNSEKEKKIGDFLGAGLTS